MPGEISKSDMRQLIEQTELAIKQAELRLKERELLNPTGALSKLRFSAAEATIFVGILALIGGFLGTYVQENNKLALKEREQESALILDALKGDDPARNLTRLTLLIDAGFITDGNGTIRTLILSGKYGSVAAPSPLSLLDAMAKGSAPTLLKEIIRAIGATPTLELREQVDFPGFAAVAKENGRVVLYYDKAGVNQFNRRTTNTWTVPAILAHEIGHVVLGHLDRTSQCFVGPINDGQFGSKDCIPVKVTELEADQFAGQVLRRLGASLEQAEQAMAFLPDTTSLTHPGRKERVEAVRRGWERN